MSRHTSDSKQRSSKKYRETHEALAEYAASLKAPRILPKHIEDSEHFRRTGDRA